MWRRRGGQPGGREQRGDGTELATAQLDHERTIRRKQASCIGGDGAVAIETFDPAIECAPRIELSDLGLQSGDVAARDIRRIGDDQIERSRQRCSVVAGQKRCAGREP